MNEAQTPTTLDQEAFRQVWRRVMPEDRPDCPFTLEPPPAPASVPTPPIPPLLPVCLGEERTDELPMLEALLILTRNSQRIYQTLARRQGHRRRGQEGRESLLTRLAQAKQAQAQKLSAARFLISGSAFPALPTDMPPAQSLALILRERYQAEQRAAIQFLAAANASADPCLIELYRSLALEDQLHARQLRDQLVRLQD